MRFEHYGVNAVSAFRSDRFVALFLVVVALAVRLFVIAITDPTVDIAGGDSTYYLQVAHNLIEHGVHSHRSDLLPAAYRPPGYPAFLVPILASGGSAFLVMAIQSLVTIAAALFTFATLRQVHRPLAIGVSLLIASSPFIALFEIRLLSELLYVILVWVAWLLLLPSPGKGIWHAIVAGILLGAAILTRDTLLLLPLFALPFAFAARQPVPMLKRLLVAAATAYLVAAPWALRNAAVLDGKPALSEGRLGLNLWVGTWERNSDWILPGLANADFPTYAFRNAGEAERLKRALREEDDAPFRQVAVDRIKGEPLGVLWTWVSRQPKMWLGTRSDLVTLRPERGSAAWVILKSGFYAVNLLFLVLGLCGLLLSVVERSRWAFFSIPVLYTVASYLPFHSTETRYSLVALPFLYLFSAFAIIRFFERRGSTQPVTDLDSQPAARLA